MRISPNMLVRENAKKHSAKRVLKKGMGHGMIMYRDEHHVCNGENLKSV